MTRIGLAYVSGAVPGFEDFGNLPTDIVKENGLVDGLKASDELDALIIPGGTLIESNDINMDLNREIRKIIFPFLLHLTNLVQPVGIHYHSHFSTFL